MTHVYRVVWYMKVKRENELTLHWAEMRMIRWMCGVKLRDELSCVESRKVIWSETVGLRTRTVSDQKVVLVLVLQVWCCVVKHDLVTLVVIMILKDATTHNIIWWFLWTPQKMGLGQSPLVESRGEARVGSLETKSLRSWRYFRSKDIFLCKIRQ